MCTVTVVPMKAGHRMVCNRDEQRTRPASTGLKCRALGNGAVLMPLDPQSGGTWIGAAETGVTACLLNANPGFRTASFWTGRKSRGVIVPQLLAAAEIHDVVDRLLDLDAAEYPPFHVLVVGDGLHCAATSDGRSLEVGETARLSRPLMLTSSAIGDDLVRLPRAELFAQMLQEHEDPCVAQDRFHAHRWPDRPEFSVNMTRSDARTVSRTVFEIDVDKITGRYEQLHEESADLDWCETVTRLCPAGARAGMLVGGRP